MQRTAMAILGHEADARDAVAEALVSIWRELPRLRDPLAFEAWSIRIVVHACRHRLRGRRRARVRELTLDAAEAGRSLPSAAGPDDDVADRRELHGNGADPAGVACRWLRPSRQPRLVAVGGHLSRCRSHD